VIDDGHVGAHRSVAVAVVLLCTRMAAAEPDNRPGDRFFFGIYGGSTDGGSGGGYEVSAWPNDYIGILAGTSFASAGPTTTTTMSSTTFEWGAAVVGAVPLRYIQPYAGGYAGFARSWFGGWNGEGTGFHTDFHPVIGVNGYVSRNLRLYVQWRPVSIHRNMEGVDDPSTDFYTVGLRWSPDAFHRARTVNKIDLVWGSVSFSCLLWLFFNLSQHNAHANAGTTSPTPPGNGMSP
jgi:hypothetical protein